MEKTPGIPKHPETTKEVRRQLTLKFFNALKYSSNIVREKLGGDAEIAIVLGSGLGGLVKELEDPVVSLVSLFFKTIEYADIPFMPLTTVQGHGKTLYRGTIQGRKVICWQGKKY